MDKNELQQYQILLKEIEAIDEEIERLRDYLKSPVKQCDSIIKSNNHYDKMADLVSKIADFDDLLIDKKMALIDDRIAIEKAIDVLDSADRLLFRLRYIEGLKWEDVADKMGYSVQRVWQKHSKVLNGF